MNNLNEEELRNKVVNDNVRISYSLKEANQRSKRSN